MMEEQIIEFLKDHPEVYDFSNRNYKNIKLKEKLWSDLGKITNTDVNVVKRKWKILRDYFYKEDKRRNAASSSGAPLNKPWKFYNSLLFLKDSRKTRPTHANGEEEADFQETSGNPGDAIVNCGEENIEEILIEGPFADSFFLEESRNSTPTCNSNPRKKAKLEKVEILNAQNILEQIVTAIENRTKEKAPSSMALFFQSMDAIIEEEKLPLSSRCKIQKEILSIIEKEIENHKQLLEIKCHRS